VQLGQRIVGDNIVYFLGYSISLSASGTKIAIGAYGSENFKSRGHTEVHELINGIWVQPGTDILGEANDDRSGIAVSLSSDGTRVAIGAPGNDDGGDEAGQVRVYEYDVTASPPDWIQIGSSIDGDTDDQFGTSVSISSN
jgi:hypothetical protein